MTEEEYQQTLEWLYAQIPNYQELGEKAYKPGLDNITKLCSFFGNPQEALNTVHIAGTNGKGSTSSMISSVLQEAGYKTGLYTSPHLIDFRERIKINGQVCGRDFVFHFVEKLKKLPADIYPSFFEFTTVMAFEYFKKQKVDIAVIEVGLGGRLDATNIIQPLVTAITNVSLDHQNFLGDTVEEIAREKAGIIKPTIPVICGDHHSEVSQIVRSIAERCGSPFIDATKLTVQYGTDLKGNYQSKNIKVATAVLSELQKKGWKVSEEAMMQGFQNVQKNTGLLGRWFIFKEEPLTICDTAHNEAGMQEVFRQLNLFPHKKHLILGFATDKNVEKIVALLPEHAQFYFAKPNVSRGRDPHLYEDTLKKSKISYKILSSIQACYLAAKQEVQKGELIFISGSNFVVGEFLEKNLEK